MFIQPKVTLENGDVTLLDNAIGANFAVIGWGCNPLWGMSDEQIQQWRVGHTLHSGGAGSANSYRTG